MNPLRPYRCTVCLESFEHDINLQLHYLSPQHQERARPNLQKTLLGLQATLHGLQDESKSDQSVNLQDVGAHSAGMNLIPDLFEKMNQAHLNQQSNEQLQTQLHHQLNLRLLQQTMEQSQQIRERAQLNQSEERSERSAESPASFVSKSPQPSNPSVHPEIEKTLLEALFSSNQTPSEEFIIQFSRESGIDLDKIRSTLDQKKIQTSLLSNPKANIMSLANQIGGSSRNESLEISKSDASDSVSTKESFSDEESSENRELKIVENDVIGQNDSPTSKATSPTSKAQPMSTSSSLTSSSAVVGGTASVPGHHHVQPHAHGQDTKPLNSSTHSDNDNSTNRRMRTLISPDQAEVLYREYLEVSFISELPGRKIIFEFRTIVHHDSVWKRLQPRLVSRDGLFKSGFKIQERENEKDNIDPYQCLLKASPQLK